MGFLGRARCTIRTNELDVSVIRMALDRCQQFARCAVDSGSTTAPHAAHPEMSYHVTQSAFRGRRASHLPCRYVDIPGMQLQLDYLLLNDVTEGFRMIHESAARGANVGVDEYPDEESFRDLIKWCDVFAFKCGSTGRLQALIAIKPSFFSRTVPVYSARIYVFCSAELETVDVNAFGRLLSLAQRLVRETGTYYTGCMMLIFRKCDAMLLELRKQKFLIIAQLPLGGALVGVGKCETLVLYKDFDGVEPIDVSFRYVGQRKLSSCHKEMYENMSFYIRVS